MARRRPLCHRRGVDRQGIRHDLGDGIPLSLPVFTYDKHGRVTGLLHVALTNNPALDQLPELQVAALSRLVSLTQSVIQEESAMDELIEQLRWLLNLPVGATADDIKAQLQKLVDQLSMVKAQLLPALTWSTWSAPCSSALPPCLPTRWTRPVLRRSTPCAICKARLQH